MEVIVISEDCIGVGKWRATQQAFVALKSPLPKARWRAVQLTISDGKLETSVPQNVLVLPDFATWSTLTAVNTDYERSNLVLFKKKSLTFIMLCFYFLCLLSTKKEKK